MSKTQSTIFTPVQNWLNTLGARERKWVVFAVLLLVLVLFWVILVQPALRKITQAQTSLPDLEGQYALVQSIAQEAKVLQAQTPIANLPTANSLFADVQSCYGAAGQAQTQADRILVTLNQVAPDVLARCLMAQDVFSADLNRADGVWSGQLQLLVPSSPQ